MFGLPAPRLRLLWSRSSRCVDGFLLLLNRASLHLLLLLPQLEPLPLGELFGFVGAAVEKAALHAAAKRPCVGRARLRLPWALHALSLHLLALLKHLVLHHHLLFVQLARLGKDVELVR